MRCEAGKFPIKLIQGDSFRNTYTFYDKDGNIITNEHIANVYWSCARLNYQQMLQYDEENTQWVFSLTAEQTAEFVYCRTTCDLTLYFTDEQVNTIIYNSEIRVCEKKNDVVADIVSGGEPFDVTDIYTEVYTGLIVTATNQHNMLYNRDLPNQHPMSAITGLEDALEGKADADDIPTATSQLTNDSRYVDETYVDGEIDDLQEQIDAIVSRSDVIDVVGTYADLLAYDTSSLSNNDVVKVLSDNTHNNARSYYRWVIDESISSWVYIGSEAISYTKAEADTLLNEKINISQGISNVGKIFKINAQGNAILTDIATVVGEMLIM